MFRNQNGKAGDSTEIEDLFGVEHYLEMFNKAYASELKGKPLTFAELPEGTRVVSRIDAALSTRKLVLRAGGGFNHYLVARDNIGALSLDAAEMDAFEALFAQVNSRLKSRAKKLE
jgi:hypothetical protein